MEEHHDVIIIGSGIAGLAAANKMKEYEYDYVLLEARNRPGGRILTDNSLGIPLDMGASWIHGTDGNPIKYLADKYEAQTTKTDDEKSVILYNTDGKKLGSGQLKAIDRVWHHFMDSMEEEQKKVSFKESLGILVKKFKKILTKTSVPKLNYELAWQIELDMGKVASKLSEKNWNKVGYLLLGAQVVFPKGYSQIVNGLVNEIGKEKIKLNQSVTKIEYNEDGVTVITDKLIFKGNYAICTLPLGVLKNKDGVEFCPPLPEPKINAINRLEMGTFHKTYFKFEKPFWDDKDWINYIPKRKGEWITFFNIHNITKEPILLGLNYGGYASYLETLPKDKIRDAGMGVLKTIYPDAPDPMEVMVTTWKEDPLSRGAYSTSPVGEHLVDYDRLAEPVIVENHPRVFFAGEATTRMYPATVHGAYLSGIREANRLHAYDKNEFPPAEEQLVKEWGVFPEYVICKPSLTLMAKKIMVGNKLRYCAKCVAKEEIRKYLKEGWKLRTDNYLPE